MSDLRKEIFSILDDFLDGYGIGEPEYYLTRDHETISTLERLVAAEVHEAEKNTASKIFNLAHEYAQEDKNMRGAEELRAYHYYNAISKIGDFDGR